MRDERITGVGNLLAVFEPRYDWSWVAFYSAAKRHVRGCWWVDQWWRWRDKHWCNCRKQMLKKLHGFDVCPDMAWHDMTQLLPVSWHDMTWHDLTKHDTITAGIMTRHDMTWHDTITAGMTIVVTWHDRMSVVTLYYIAWWHDDMTTWHDDTMTWHDDRHHMKFCKYH